MKDFLFSIGYSSDDVLHLEVYGLLKIVYDYEIGAGNERQY
jgi:hypothetical protein